MKCNIFFNPRTQKNEINPSPTGTWDSAELAQAVCDKENEKLAEKLSVSQIAEREHAMLIAGIPSEKSLKNISAKLDAIKRAEEIENEEN